MLKIFFIFHLVQLSSWPIFVSLCSMNLILSFIVFFKLNNFMFIFLCSFFLSFSMFFWWKDICIESISGEFSMLTIDNLKLGMLFFILSEVCFFFGFFWSFFHYSISPSIELGSFWPPISLLAVNPFSVPLLNTVVLLSSGVTVTWAHMQIINNLNSELSLFFTLVLGVYFSLLQGFEYYLCGFSISDSAFGSIFFIATGFHGAHVLIGSLFLLICLLRALAFHFSSVNLLGVELGIWYWHFVDVVWLFLFSFIYWWGF